MSSLLVVPKTHHRGLSSNDFLTEFGIYNNYISTFEGCLHKVSKYHFSKKSVELQIPKIN